MVVFGQAKEDLKGMAEDIYNSLINIGLKISFNKTKYMTKEY